MKTEVYSWRVSTDLKTDLEREARRRKTSVSAVLDLAARRLLEETAEGSAVDEEQLRLQRAAAKHFGAIEGRDPGRAENARQSLRRRLQERHGAKRPD